MVEKKTKKLTEEQIFAIMCKRELERRHMMEDEVYFFENYIKIENKSGKTPDERSILFKLFPEQKRVLKEINENKLNIIIKARQLGMTWLAVGHGLHESLKIPQYTVIILSQTEDYMKEAIDRFEYNITRLPKWLIREYNKETQSQGSMYLYEKTSDVITIYHPVKVDGTREQSSIKGLVSTEGAGRSITADLIIFDEWAYHAFAEDVFQAAYPTINRPDSGTFIGISTNKRGSYFENIVLDCMDEGKMGFNLIFLNCFADIRRNQEWLERTKATLKNTWQIEYPVKLTDALSAGNLTAFGEFDPKIHVCEPFEIPKHWIKWSSTDNGLRDPFCWFKLAVDEDGTTYVYYEYTRDKNKDPIVYYKDQAEKFMQDCMIDVTDKYNDEINNLHLGFEVGTERHYEKENLQYSIFGLDAFSTDTAKGTNKSLLTFYHEGGFNYPEVKATTNRKLSKSIVNEYLKPYNDNEIIEGRPKAKLQIFSTCKFLIKYIPQLVVEDNNPNVVAGNPKIDNVYDALAYGLIGSPRNNAKVIKQPETQIEKYKHDKIRRMKKGKHKKGILN